MIGPPETLPLSGAGPPLDDCGAAAGYVCPSSPLLSSASESSSLSTIDLSVLLIDPAIDLYFAQIGYVHAEPEQSTSSLKPDDLVLTSKFDLDTDADDRSTTSTAASTAPSDSTLIVDDAFAFDSPHLLRTTASLPFPSLLSPPSSAAFTPSAPSPLVDCVNALHALDPLLRQTHQSRSTFYSDLATRDAAAPSITPRPAPRAHMDGGSMANTTQDITLLWHLTYFAAGVPVPTLCVADERAHHPVGFGYLRVPCLSSPMGYEMVHTFYTPTLPATILSPD